MPKLYDFDVQTIHNETQSLQKYEGNVLLIVNVASACGFTPQYKELQTLYQNFKDQGFYVLAFPSNQFGLQEKGSNEEISAFCDLNFNISFPLFSKINVNGKNESPLYTFMKNEQKGLLGSKDIKWNFTKFLVDRQGQVIKRFAPSTSPLKIQKDILELL